MNELVLRQSQEEDIPKILDLFKKCFGHEMTKETWLWRFRDNPAGVGFSESAWDGDKLVGQYTGASVTLQIDGVEQKAVFGGPGMIDPDYRGLDLYSRLYERIEDKMKKEGIVLFYSINSVPRTAHRLLINKLGFTDIYEIPTFRLKIDKLTNCVVPCDGEDVTGVFEFDERFDRLWDISYSLVGIKRDTKYLNWRFSKNPGTKYRTFVARFETEISGYAVTKIYKKELQIVDILPVDDPVTGLKLVSKIVGFAKDTGLDSVSLWLNTADPLHQSLERYGFLPSEPVFYFCAKGIGYFRDAVFDYRNWNVMMSDSDIF